MTETMGLAGATQWGAAPSTPAATLAPGARFGERYEIVKELGAGGMGVVYLADDTLTDRQIVLKLIHPSLVDERAVKRMIEEGVLASQIRHPNVVAVHHVDQIDGQTFLTMEYVEGKSLRDWIAEGAVNHRDTPVETAAAIVREILEGLGAAHEAGVVHRDLKPENVLLTGDPEKGEFGLKILDFGIARGLKTEVFTSSNTPMGTPNYMAPEQQRTPDAVGPSADIYSVGRIFYELLIDVLPTGPLSPPSRERPDLPAALDLVLAKADSIRPRSRYQNVAEFQAAIEEALGHAAPAPGPEPEKSEEADPLKHLEDARKRIEEKLPKNKVWRYALIAIAVMALLGALIEEMGLDSSDTVATLMEPADPIEPITPIEPVGPNKPVQPIKPVEPVDPDPSEGEMLRQRFARFAGFQNNWRVDSNGAVYVVKQNNAGELAGYGQMAGHGEVVFFGVNGSPLEVLRLSDGESIGELNGGIGLQQSGGYDYVGVYFDYASGVQSPVRMHINH